MACSIGSRCDSHISQSDRVVLEFEVSRRAFEKGFCVLRQKTHAMHFPYTNSQSQNLHSDVDQLCL